MFAVNLRCGNGYVYTAWRKIRIGGRKAARVCRKTTKARRRKEEKRRLLEEQKEEKRRMLGEDRRKEDEEREAGEDFLGHLKLARLLS